MSGIDGTSVPYSNRKRGSQAKNRSTREQSAQRDERWHAVLESKTIRDKASEISKANASLACPGDLHRGGRAATQSSLAATNPPIPDNRRARRILARYGNETEISEFIEVYGYDCTVADFIARYRAGSAKIA